MNWTADVPANMNGVPYSSDLLYPLVDQNNPLSPVTWGSSQRLSEHRYPFVNDFSAQLSGLGTATTDQTISTQVQAGTFTEDLMRGAKEWLAPGAAFTALNDVAMGHASAPIAYTVGLAAPPVILLVMLLGLMKGRR